MDSRARRLSNLGPKNPLGQQVQRGSEGRKGMVGLAELAAPCCPHPNPLPPTHPSASFRAPVPCHRPQHHTANVQVNTV